MPSGVELVHALSQLLDEILEFVEARHDVLLSFCSMINPE